MDIGQSVAQWREQLQRTLDTLGPDNLYNLWLASGALILVAVLWFSHRVMRHALGHRKFRGTWYTESQFETLITMIDEDSKRNNRVMRHDEMRLLRQWRFGSANSISDGVKTYF